MDKFFAVRALCRTSLCCRGLCLSIIVIFITFISISANTNAYDSLLNLVISDLKETTSYELFRPRKHIQVNQLQGTSVISMTLSQLKTEPKNLVFNRDDYYLVGSKIMPKAPSLKKSAVTNINIVKSTLDVWSRAKIVEAKDVCREIFLRVKADVELIEPIKQGSCGDPAPVKLSALKGKHTVRFSSAATVNCQMVLALDTWVRRGLQPLAQEHLGAPIKSVIVMGSYSCRNRYNNKNAKLSEHAKANALDIEGFYTSDGIHVDLLTHWGPTRRDANSLSKKLESHWSTRMKNDRNNSKGYSLMAPLPLPERQPGLPNGYERKLNGEEEQMQLQPIEERKKLTNDLLDTKPSLKKLLRSAPVKADNVLKLKENLELGRTNINRSVFLRGAHRTACRIFGTVLGPEANDAHRNHFHIDLASRRYKNYCE